MNLVRRIEKYHRAVVGQVIRGQVVEHVEVVIDTNGKGAGIRCFVHVYFRENPTTEESPEKNLLQRVFNDVPKYATSGMLSRRELLAILRSRRQPAWKLEDE